MADTEPDRSTPTSNMTDIQDNHPQTSSVDAQPQRDGAADAGGICHFWRLPQELLDTIFNYVYACDPPRCIVTKSGFQRVEADRIRSGGHNYTPQPMPPPKVNEFMVSKDFFLNAAHAWFAVQTWARGPKMYSSLYKSGIYYEFGAVCVTEPGRSSLHAVAACKRLREAKITMRVEAFDELTPAKFAWIDELGPRDFESLAFTAEMKKVRGLRRLLMTAGISAYTMTGERDRIWHANVAALREYLWPFVSAPKEKEERRAGEAPLPLYEGSRVCYDRSELLPEDYYLERGKKGGRFVVAEKYRNGLDRGSREPPTTFEELGSRTTLSPQAVWKLIEDAKRSVC